MALAQSSVEASAAADIANGGCSTDGPVLSVIGKRLRALRKKYNRILQMEESVSQGKPLNKEQEEVLRSKPAVTLLIDEYEKLRQPLASALEEELSLLPPPPPSSEPPATTADPDALDASEVLADKAVGDLVTLLYFALLFDVKREGEFKDIMVMRNHERDRCLTYDYVTDEAADLLGDADLDAISHLGASITSRPENSGDPHLSTLEGCVQHAKLWLQNADQPIQTGTLVTYAALREKLNKILASDYCTSVSGMKSAADVAAVVGKFAATCQVQISGGVATSSPTVEEEGVAVSVIYQHEDNEQQDIHASQFHPEHDLNPVDELPKMAMLDAADNASSAEQENQNLEVDAEGNYQRDFEQRDQQQSTNRRFYQRGGNHGDGGNGGRRGYSNSRGGRVGRGGNGGYQNGQNYDSGYYSRNYNNSRGRGGRSGGPGMYADNHGGSHGGYAPARVES